MNHYTIKTILQYLAWDVLNPMLLNLKKKRSYNFNNKYIGINLGCGLDNPPRWIGVDGGITHLLVHKSPKFFSRFFFNLFTMKKNYSFDEYFKKIKNIKLIHHELLFGIPFNSNIIPNIYSSHFFEHLFFEDAKKLFQECYRVIKDNGIIRIAVPSLKEEVQNIKDAIKEYEKGEFSHIQKFLTTDLVGYNNYYSNHRYMYNFDILYQLLSNSGFRDIKEYSMGEGKIPDVELLDTRQSLFVEATK